MKTKTKLIYMILSLGLVLFSIQPVFAQKESEAMLPSNQHRSYILSSPHHSFYDYNAFNQDIDNNLKTKNFYLQRSNNQRTAGWILFGAGTAMVVIGGIGFGSNFDISLFTPSDPAKERRANTFGVIMLTGIAADLISIPFFISAHHNKKKAASLSYSNQTIYIPQNRSYCNIDIPSMTLKINF